MNLIIYAICLFAQCCDHPDCAVECVPPTSCEEQEFLSQIDCMNRRLYNSLDCEGKKRALELFPYYEDKNCAVQQAAKEMGQQELFEQREKKTYSQQLEEKSSQEKYNSRFGY